MSMGTNKIRKYVGYEQKIFHIWFLAQGPMTPSINEIAIK